MPQQIFEGTWEEIRAHDEELMGRHVMVIVTDPPENGDLEVSSDAPAKPTLAETLKGRTGRVSFEPTDLSRDTGKRFADLMKEKTVTHTDPSE